MTGTWQDEAVERFREIGAILLPAARYSMSRAANGMRRWVLWENVEHQTALGLVYESVPLGRYLFRRSGCRALARLRATEAA